MKVKIIPGTKNIEDLIHKALAEIIKTKVDCRIVK